MLNGVDAAGRWAMFVASVVVQWGAGPSDGPAAVWGRQRDDPAVLRFCGRNVRHDVNSTIEAINTHRHIYTTERNEEDGDLRLF